MMKALPRATLDDCTACALHSWSNWHPLELESANLHDRFSVAFT